MTELANGMWWVLEQFRGLTGSYGLAVIGLTLVVRALLLPLGFAQLRAMEGQKRLQPKLQELQKKYREKPQELQRRMMELYREERLNPFSGCLPSLVQLPILWALWLALRRLPEGSLFLLWDLGRPDRMFVWPILAALTQYLSMKPTMTDPKQSSMIWMMSAMTGLFAATFPSGLALYWTVSNVLTFGQYWFFQRRLGTAEGGVRAT
ncbi:MAG: membrane protein insertase YidC [Limnochordaceae bacterium]|uniref:YidC/Oxa1 family membrane protein insertase n=1 Tax=Carboxydichorda subterranea TaxID=3109565 RepID=A0ABZ1BX62_9FIRM|nr:YidC/Oxa1 family membrane protein insertase [Limnochorda sp. L945t]MBE3599640.1 membrane protein insertase YidC [Limnochordaceae bacterium]WRP17116.1 YidC/Oxa1 family membrane protein insertase [Limnochorda sp. L945t]